jgi:pSer/pThr/pTyr-binding forkhead associated (FHA) protein
MFDTPMPFIILGQQRYALPIGETRIGGVGAGAVPFPQLAAVETVAVLCVAHDGGASLRSCSNGTASLAIDGGPIGSNPVKLTHGAKIDVGGVRLVFGDLREAGATIQVAGVAGSGVALPFLGGEGEPTADCGGRLTVLESGAVVPIPDGGLTIGRDPECHCVIRGQEVSRRHAAIRASLQGYVLRDLSTNGTYVNGRRVDGSQVLGMGDVLRIGDEQLRFEADPASYEPSAELRQRDSAMPTETPTEASSLERTTAPRLEAIRLLATLEVVNGGAPKGTCFRIERPVVHLGRGTGSDVRLSHGSVSDSHATLSRRDGSWVVVDRGSASGTFVNGHRVAGQQALPRECALRIGDVILKFRDGDGAPPPPSDTRSNRGFFSRLAKLWRT